MEDREGLASELRFAAQRRLRNLCKQAGDQDERNYPILTRIVKTVAGEQRWRSNPNQSLIDVMRMAIDKLPETMSGRSINTSAGNNIWKGSPERRIAEILYGYRDDELPTKHGIDDAGRTYSKDYYFKAIELVVGNPIGASTARRVTRIIRQDIADILLGIERDNPGRDGLPDNRADGVREARVAEPRPPYPDSASEQNRWYIDREGHNEKFNEALQQLSAMRKLIVFVGLPGMGKTWLATSVTRASSDSSIVVVRASTQDGIVKLSTGDLQSAFDSCGIKLGQVLGSDPTHTDYLAHLLSCEQAPAFLVIDNLESTAQLQQLLPRQYRSIVVATCRVAENPPPECRIIEVGKMTPAEAQAMIRKRLPELSAEDARLLATTLHDYPLVIDHACRLLAVQQLPVAVYCRDIRTRRAAFTAASVTEENNQTLRIVIGDLVEALQTKNSLAADLLLFQVHLVHEGLYELPPELSLPQGLLNEALHWRNGRVVSISEYLEALSALSGYFYVEIRQDQSRAYRSVRLNSIELHPLVSELLFKEVYGYRERVIAAACLVRGAMTYAGRSEVRGDRESSIRDWAPMILGILLTVSALLTNADHRARFKQLEPARRYEIELWFTFHGRKYMGSSARALRYVDQAIASQPDAALYCLYSELHKRFIFKSQAEDKGRPNSSR